MVAYARSMFGFLRSRGLYDECERRLGIAEAAARRMGDQRGLARLLNQQGLAAWDRFDLAGAQKCFEASFAISEELGDKERVLPTLINLGNVQWGGGDVQAARAAWERALGLADEQHHIGYRAVLSMCLGIAAMDVGEFDRSEALLAEALAVHRQRGNGVGEAMTLYNLSDLRSRQGREAEALEAARQALQLSEEGGEARNAALARVRVARLSGERAEAERLAKEGLTIARQLGDSACEIYAEDTLGLIAASQGDHEEAVRRYATALAVAARTASELSAADVLTNAAASLARVGRPRDALLAAVAAAEQYERRGLAGIEAARRVVETVQEEVGAADRPAVVAEAEALGVLGVAARLGVRE